ncbi:MAG: glycoside hydrolase family 36 protein [Proteiniphilum sp.]|nr:alpha-galactosidase [Proteiniphilum sp.]
MMTANISNSCKLLFATLSLLFVLLPELSTAQQKIRYSDKPVVITRWIHEAFAKGKTPPFSFELDGKKSSDFIKSWDYSFEKQVSTEVNVVKYCITYESKQAGLRIDCEVEGYTDYDAVKWLLHFTNIQDADSKVISHVKVIDVDFEYARSGDFILHTADGNHISKADFHPRSLVMKPGEEHQFFPEGGRSSETSFPFFNIESPANQGVVFSIGWSGTWISDFMKKTDRVISFSSGMKRFESYLKSNETIRTPSMCLLFWNAENRMEGHNKFRRFVLAHQSRKIDGKFATYPLSSGFNYHDPEPCTEYSCLTEDYAIAMIRRYTQFGLIPEVYWLDAGWYSGAANFEQGQTWANTVGNWTVDTTRFPNGLKPIAEEAHKVGAKFMVWFEPERVIEGTQWAREHPEWMLRHGDGDWLLFDLGNRDARKWMTQKIINLIRENGIDYYRQDFNMRPDVYWEANDEPGRIGMKEVRHIEGLYAFWDDLLTEFPNLLIDNCASGGRRLDMETIPRSAPLWRSDYYHYDDPDGYQGHTYGLNFFLPLHGTGILQTDRYSFRSSMSSALIYNWKITDKSVSYIDMQNCLKEYASVRPYYYEDYYPLVGIEDLTRDNIWIAYQLHRPTDESGIIVAFRREKSPDDRLTVQLGGLKKDENYLITSMDDESFKCLKSSKELNEGFDLMIEEPRGSLLLKYSIVK